MSKKIQISNAKELLYVVIVMMVLLNIFNAIYIKANQIGASDLRENISILNSRYTKIEEVLLTTPTPISGGYLEKFWRARHFSYIVFPKIFIKTKDKVNRNMSMRMRHPWF